MLCLTSIARLQEQAQAEEQPGYELEQWIVDFASLFRDHTGIDPDKHLDLQVGPPHQASIACRFQTSSAWSAPGTSPALPAVWRSRATAAPELAHTAAVR